MQGMMGNYVEQSKTMFAQMQEQMQKKTEQMLGAFGMKTTPRIAARGSPISWDNTGV